MLAVVTAFAVTSCIQPVQVEESVVDELPDTTYVIDYITGDSLMIIMIPFKDSNMIYEPIEE